MARTHAARDLDKDLIRVSGDPDGASPGAGAQGSEVTPFRAREARGQGALRVRYLLAVTRATRDDSV
jgi:hypothetical protein